MAAPIFTSPGSANVLSAGEEAATDLLYLRQDGTKTYTGDLLPSSAGARTLGSASADNLRVYTRFITPGTSQVLVLEDASGQDVITIADSGALTLATNSVTAGVTITAALLTTGIALDIPDADALGLAGSILNLVSNSINTEERNLVFIHNDNALAVNATCLFLRQDATDPALEIDMNANSVALLLKVTGSSAAAVKVLVTVDGVANCLTLINSQANAGGSTNEVCDITFGFGTNEAVAVIRIGKEQDYTVGANEDSYMAFFTDLNGTVAEKIRITSAGTLQFGQASSITTTTGALTITPTTDTLFANGTGVVIGHTAQVTAGSLGELQVLGTAAADSTVIIGLWSADAVPPTLEFVKSQDTTIGSNTIVADNDVIGSLSYYPDDGVGFATLAASFTAEVDDASPAADDIGMAFVWQQMPGGGGAIAETMRLTATGTLLFTTAQTTTHVIDVPNADSLGLGASILNLVSNSVNTEVRTLVQITNDNTLAVGATCLTITQDAAQVGLKINQSGVGAALFVVQSGSNFGIRISHTPSGNSVALSITSAATTPGGSFSLNADSLTTGRAMFISSDSADVQARTLAKFLNDHVDSVGCTVLELVQDAAQRVLFIDMNADGASIVIDTEATTAPCVSILVPKNTTGHIFDVTADALTSGKIASFLSNSAATNARVLVQISNLHVDADAAQCLSLDQNGLIQAMTIDMAANDAGFIDFVGSSGTGAVLPLSTGTTIGALFGHIQIEFNGVSKWLAVYDDPSA